MMSSCIDSVVAEQLCYIPCNFCNIMLAVSVPCSSLYDMVTVRCGHCTNLWSVNMAAALSLQHLQAQHSSHNNAQNYWMDSGSSSKGNKKNIATRDSTEEFINRPPEKKQRVPSAYNQFIKEEIQRIKANNPDISHKEAFSTAAKNWAHFPRSFWADVGDQQSD